MGRLQAAVLWIVSSIAAMCFPGLSLHVFSLIPVCLTHRSNCALCVCVFLGEELWGRDYELGAGLGPAHELLRFWFPFVSVFLCVNGFANLAH